MLRRIIERIIQRQLEHFISLNENQRGFIRKPGVQINTAIVGGCLQKAKEEQRTVIIPLLDISKAFEESSQEHIDHKLDHRLMPSKLRNLTKNLTKHNEAKIIVKRKITKSVPINRSVFQGSNISPIVFNESIDHVINEMTEPEITKKYGFQIHPDVGQISATFFADDGAAIGNSRESAIELVKIAIHNLEKVGYKVNPDKCVAICIENGELTEEPSVINSDITIRALKSGEKIKYLGTDFKNVISFDRGEMIKNFSKSMQNLVSSPLLRSKNLLYQPVRLACSYFAAPVGSTQPTPHELPQRRGQNCEERRKRNNWTPTRHSERHAIHVLEFKGVANYENQLGRIYTTL